MNQIEIKKIKYKKQLVLNKTSLKIAENGICLINGANGSGKTSLAKELVRTNHHLILYMMQGNNILIDELGVLENISFNQVSFQKIKNILKILELEYLIYALKIEKLSGGEKRIISLLRCLLSDAPIIILDEPINDIDIEMKEKIIFLVEYIAQYKYIIIISHVSCFKNYQYNYIIEDKKLKLLEDRTDSDVSNIVFNKRKLRNFYPDKQNYLYVLLPIFFLVFVFYSLYNFNLEKYQSSINDNSIRITTYSATNSDPSEYFDTSLLKCLEFKNTKKCLSNNLVENDRNFTNNINISKEYEYYVLEYYDEKNRQYFNIENEIEENLSNNFQYNVKIKYPIAYMLFNNKENIIWLPNKIKDNMYLEKIEKLGFKIKRHVDNEILVSFNSDFFKEYSKDFLKYNKVDVLINNKTKTNFVDFIMENKLDKQILLMKNQDTEKFFYELNQFVGVKGFIKMIIVPWILMYLLLTIVIIFLEKAQIKNKRIIYNYGFDTKTIYNKTLYKYRVRMHDIFILIMGIVIITFTYLKFENYMLTIVSLLIILNSLLFSILIRFLIKINLRRMIR